MLHKLSQNQELFELLTTRGPQGVNSFEPFRNNHRQLPRMIKDLEKKGHFISHIEQKNTSVTYVLTQYIVKPKKVVDYKYERGTAIPIYET